MIKYKVVVSLEFKKEFYKLPNNLQERVKKILKKLETRLFGDTLQGDLRGFYSVHFERNKYRLIYVKEDNILKLLAVHVGKRTNRFYKEFKEELKRRKKSGQSYL